jgi:Na+/H+ antiporter NhaD/arsenite permease-like protein
METVLSVPPLLMAPFALMLACIAVLPIFAEKFWESNKNKLLVSALLSAPILGWFIGMNQIGHIEETMLFDYIPFIILLGALFVITGGIHIDTEAKPKPIINLIVLAIGAILASFLGTTGAAMLLIRPIIKINAKRQFKVHTILFFIGIIANCGGLLTPLGDPPLFMMYLRGAEFSWFFRLFPEWLFANSLLLIIYYFVDNHFHNKEAKDELIQEEKTQNKITIQGGHNFLFLAIVVISVAFLNSSYLSFVKAGEFSSFIREIAILSAAALSFYTTKKAIYNNNNFEWAPIVEVAYLFLGIFITMVPCLLYLKENAASIGVTLPYQFYYASGALSSFLDNTPTAVTFHSLALGLGSTAGQTLEAGIPEILLKAISIGSVYFGAMTYIGNGPNFMVKSIAENNGIKMPHFFAYMYKFSLIVLLPIYVLIQFIFIGF